MTLYVCELTVVRYFKDDRGSMNSDENVTRHAYEEFFKAINAAETEFNIHDVHDITFDGSDEGEFKIYNDCANDTEFIKARITKVTYDN